MGVKMSADNINAITNTALFVLSLKRSFIYPYILEAFCLCNNLQAMRNGAKRMVRHLELCSVSFQALWFSKYLYVYPFSRVKTSFLD
jgi:hypothetical protein